MRLEVFDAQGRLVDVVPERDCPKGVHAVEWEVPRGGVRPGIYLCRLVAGAYKAVGKMLILDHE